MHSICDMIHCIVSHTCVCSIHLIASTSALTSLARHTTLARTPARHTPAPTCLQACRIHRPRIIGCLEQRRGSSAGNPCTRRVTVSSGRGCIVCAIRPTDATTLYRWACINCPTLAGSPRNRCKYIGAESCRTSKVNGIPAASLSTSLSRTTTLKPGKTSRPCRVIYEFTRARRCHARRHWDN
jgi:hypothetical protein